MNFDIRGTTIEVRRGDLTTQAVDAVVNSAQPELTGGQGVDGALHSAGGPAVLEACRAHVQAHGPLRAGNAVVTTAGALPAKWIVHTVGPRWRDGMHGENVQLERAYWRSLAAARTVGARTIAFPSISTGTFGFPVETAALIAWATLFRYALESPGVFTEIAIVTFAASDHEVYARRFGEVVRTQIGTTLTPAVLHD